MDIRNLQKKLQGFADERDWEQFHSPKNLVMALSGEVGELTEHFQWLTEEQSKDLSDDKLIQVGEELADIQMYLARLADKLGVDLEKVVDRKIEINAQKYPARKVRGSAKKYTEYVD